MKKQDIKKRIIEKIIDKLFDEKIKEREYTTIGIIMPNDVKLKQMTKNITK